MTTWIFPANPDDFEIENAFQELKKIDWGTNNKVKTGDTVFIYKSKGKNNIEGKIIIEAKVIKDHVFENDIIDDKKFWLNRTFDFNDYKKCVRLKPVRDIFNNEISNELLYSKLVENGLRSKMYGPIILDNNYELKKYIENILSFAV